MADTDPTIKELQEQIERAKEVLRERHKSRAAELRKEIVDMADSLDQPLEQVVSDIFELHCVKSRPKPAAKYRHPRDPRLTWTGRGRRPHWLETYIREGGKIESCEV